VTLCFVCIFRNRATITGLAYYLSHSSAASGTSDPEYSGLAIDPRHNYKWNMKKPTAKEKWATRNFVVKMM
jgi:hypothetical protein